MEIRSKIKGFLVLWAILGLYGCGNNSAVYYNSLGSLPVFSTDTIENDSLGILFHIAVGDFAGNIRPYKGGLLEQRTPVIFAGSEYYGPWSRDGAINTYNAGNLLFPEASKSTLLANLQKDKSGRLVFGGEYWDNVLLGEAFLHYFYVKGDMEFLALGFEALKNTLADREKEEFDAKAGLFRGASFFNDGISGYGDKYARTGKYEGADWVSNIKKWVQVEENKPMCAKKGFGLPMMCLSTNCIYYRAYEVAIEMDKALGGQVSPEEVKQWRTKADALKTTINAKLWDPKRRKYNYLIDGTEIDTAQEGAGIAMAILWGVADNAQAEALFSNTYRTAAGLPCVWPSYARYTTKGGYGRHSGTVWPQVQGFWTAAAASKNRSDIFWQELNTMFGNAWPNKLFDEIYHPVTRKPYGGMQEDNNGEIVEWHSVKRTNWAAAFYIRLMTQELMGIKPVAQGLAFKPVVPVEFKNLELRNLSFRKCALNIKIKGYGTKLKTFKINGVAQEQPLLTKDQTGLQNIEIEMQP